MSEAGAEGGPASRLYASVARLRASCAADVGERERLLDERAAVAATAARDARETAGQDIAAAGGLAEPTSLGGQLRGVLAALPGVEVRHPDAGGQPATLTRTLDEWRELAPAASDQVAAIVAAHRAWSATWIRRSSSMPRVGDDLWRDLERLDVLHQSVRPLLAAAVAAAVRAAQAAVDTQIEATVARQTAARAAQAAALRGAADRLVAAAGLAATPWEDRRWDAPLPPALPERLIRLGELETGLPEALELDLVPAFLDFPLDAGLAVGSDAAGRDGAIRLLRALALRLIAAVPAGMMIVDAVASVSSGQPAHAGENDRSPLGARSWRTGNDVDSVLADLREQVEIRTSRYLRGRFATIDEYNASAGGLAEPFQVLLVFDYPGGFSARARAQLLHLARSGPPCGIYPLVQFDTDALQDGLFPATREPPRAREVDWKDGPVDPVLRALRQVTTRRLPPDGTGLRAAAWDIHDPAIGEAARGLSPDDPPPITFSATGEPRTGAAALLARVGAAVREPPAHPPAVTLDGLLAAADRGGEATSEGICDLGADAGMLTVRPETWWRGSTERHAVPLLGRGGTRDVARLVLASGPDSGGGLVVGAARTGKTNTLHAVILTLALRYPPTELRLRLVGDEFAGYEKLPHACVTRMHGDREPALAVLRGAEAEARRRADLMTSFLVELPDIAEYRRVLNERLARVIVVLDEAHKLLGSADELGRALTRSVAEIARRGPSTGIHLVAAARTVSGLPAASRVALLTLPQRVAFRCDGDDADLVLGAGNKAAGQLTGAGNGVFNAARGEESRNQPFRGLFLPADRRESIVERLGEHVAQGPGDQWQNVTAGLPMAPPAS
ncbi:FtsK/SpoIIIE domain-containing protein [Pseudofrankia asymbiotica]|uniref:FtsK domain-containing protein n=1 Tax=Pseudofrankia asymbiotica TaxID=1834516 RepID=A0A1V2I2X0_9ACTN|nr:FtsK/SpoIIIE domain-containing protein [Pseudofrankia asymbiotica]ONH24739.1 hypothetical protein BL253_29380 [Pseudofrankia asymbiotica]